MKYINNIILCIIWWMIFSLTVLMIVRNWSKVKFLAETLVVHLVGPEL